ncbi:hypothetical protein P168DRAFT_298071 [Aspergillus campestris IBT 28561]|uniref:S-adenosyl-L-methionine-dependent methyltransferase n=1 Tax=Aspergillus campestris (strain IBT 28561) TaxID=1392248 RepID=A0A2I1D079_ASPC2|nr:uncharacterized protein P168DRAFT_298071 [Aspergillus campestris IBT 28561]PKY03269.1 hypothetical protein P168DRAFT_298071 [Aspergillus campestris IBT 28561]
MVQRRKEMNSRYQIGGANADLAYGLENLWFNADLEPQSLWVNLGFWKTATHPSEACADLFRELLATAGISAQQQFSMLEVGCGCAETARLLLKEYQDKCTHWVGLTLSSLQVKMAEDRLREDTVLSHGKTKTKCQIFQADAAQPNTWNAEINDAVRSLPNPWLVSLDALCDFRPSRKPILTFARQELGVSVAVTEHLKKENMSTLDTLKTWASFRLLDTSWDRVLTRQQYIDTLVECGYKRENISIVSYSEHAYAQYSRFVSQQGRKWQEMGGSKWDYMDFSIAGFVTNWWARSGLVEACIIVARA